MSSLYRNTRILIFNTFFMVALGFVGSIVAARALGPSLQGIASFILVMSTVVAQAAGLGIQAAATYFLNRKGLSKQETVGQVIAQLLVMSVPVVAIFLIFTPSVPATEVFFGVPLQGVIGPYLAALAVATLWRANVLGLFFAFEDYKRANVWSLVGDQAFAVTVVVLAMLGQLRLDSLLVVLLGSVVGITLAQAIRLSRSHKVAVRPSWSMERLREFIIYGVQSYLMVLVRVAQQRMAYFLVAAAGGYAALGQFSISYSAERAVDVTRPFVIAHFPEASRQAKGGGEGNSALLIKSVRQFLALSLFLLPLGMAALYWAIPILYSQQYKPAALPAALLLPGMLAWALLRIFLNFLASQNKQMQALRIQGIAIVIQAAALGALWATQTLSLVSVAVAFSLVSMGMLGAIVFTIIRTENILLRLFSPDFRGALASFKKLASRGL